MHSDPAKSVHILGRTSERPAVLGANNVHMQHLADNDVLNPSHSLSQGPRFLSNDVMYSMSFSELDLQLSGKTEGDRDQVEVGKDGSRQRSGGGHLELSSLAFDAAWIITTKNASRVRVVLLP